MEKAETFFTRSIAEKYFELFSTKRIPVCINFQKNKEILVDLILQKVDEKGEVG